MYLNLCHEWTQTVQFLIKKKNPVLRKTGDEYIMLDPTMFERSNSKSKS